MTEIPVERAETKLRMLGLTLNGQFGAFPPARLRQLTDLVSETYPLRPQVSAGGAAISLPGMNIFAGPHGALIVGPTAWAVNYTASKTDATFEDAASLFRRAVALGLAPEEVAYNVQAAFYLEFAGAAQSLVAKLPWQAIEGTTLVGSGTRYVFKTEPDGVAVDLTIESDFAKPDSLIFAARYAVESAIPFEEALATADCTLRSFREAYLPMMERIATSP